MYVLCDYQIDVKFVNDSSKMNKLFSFIFESFVELYRVNF